jgi:hypothetical protein
MSIDVKKVFEESTMTEPRFWELIAMANWPDEGYNEPKLRYLKALKPIEGKEFRSIVEKLWNELDKFIGRERNPANGGDDSHSDLCYHIIGLGETEFYASMGDYKRIKARGQAPYDSPEGYKESFGYAVPYDCEWDDIKGTLEQLKDETKEDAKSDEPAEPVTDLTEAEKAEYLKGGRDCCPKCGCDIVEGGFVEIDEGRAFQEVSCNDCPAEWKDVYTINDVFMTA